MLKRKVLILIIGCSILTLQFIKPSKLPAELLKDYYLKQVKVLHLDLVAFNNSIQMKHSQKDLQLRFFKCRLVYKKLAVLTDYFNQYETVSLNSPAINRINSEVVDNIITPTGFQAIEDLLFNNWENENYKKIETLLNDMLQVLARLEIEPDLNYKFKDELVWDALRSAIVGITTNGITGLDSPTANYSLKEADATLDGISVIINFYKKTITEKRSSAFTELTNLIINAKKYLQRNNHFNNFDRLTFISQYSNPLFKKLVETRIQSGIGVPSGRHAINYNATSFFTENAFDINFYSPPMEYWVTPERIKLGKKLFSDPILSGNKSRSCATCHQPDKAFTDGLQKPFAVDNKTLLTRNTPTLYNSGYQTSQFYDSRSDILENQLTEVVHNEEEMSGSLRNSINELKKSVEYISLFNEAYPAEKNSLNSYNLTNAIACYVRSLQSLNSRFDKYMLGDYTKLTKEEKSGFNLFSGKAKCATCHFIPLFNGVVPPFYANTESEVLGVPKTKDKKNAELDEDLGKYLFIRSDIFKYSFKTPTLRNVALTAPYMHNGVYNTLEEVMEFYNNGGGKGLNIAPENQTLPFDKLNLTKNEISSIIAFMKALTDTSRK